MKHKAGDKVRTKSIEWYENNKDKSGIVVCGPQFHIFIRGSRMWFVCI